MKKTAATSVPVIQVSNVLKNKYKGAHETLKRIREEAVVTCLLMFSNGKKLEVPCYASTGLITPEGLEKRNQFLIENKLK